MEYLACSSVLAGLLVVAAAPMRVDGRVIIWPAIVGAVLIGLGVLLLFGLGMTD